MSFENDYSHLVNYSKALLKSGNFNIEAEDLINDAYLYFVENNIQYSIESVKHHIKKSFYGEVYEKSVQDPLDRDRFCKKCNDTKPISAFTFYWSSRHKKQIVSEYCAECITTNRKFKGYDYKYKKRQRELLTDVYIKDVIRRNFKGVITQEMIEQRRENIKIKRSKK